MGEPVKIFDLAKQMIRLSGLTIKKNNNFGDIEIVFTGLRSGEKLYEELLIDNNSLPTNHPLIFRAKEKFIQHSILMPLIKKLEQYCEKQELEKSFKLISEIVPEWEKSYE